jgi:hypothetical protein
MTTKAKRMEYRARFNAKHPGYYNERAKEYRERNRETLRKKHREWMKNHREVQRSANRRVSARNRTELSDRYLRDLLTASIKNIQPKDIPEPLVATYREYLKLRRICLKLKTSTNSARTSLKRMKRSKQTLAELSKFLNSPTPPARSSVR